MDVSSHMTPRSFVLALVALAFAACPPLENPMPDGGDASDSGVAPDAGDADAGVDAGLELDFRFTRGAPWTLHHGLEIAGAPFALGTDSFAVQTRCDGGACDYEWRDDSGALINRRENLRGLFGSDVARSGRVASLYDIRNVATCVDAFGGTRTLFEGDWHLLDVKSGASLTSLPNIASAAFLDPAFLRSGLHARLLVDSGCTYTSVLRATTAPYGMNQLDAASWVEDELADGRVLVSGAPETLVMHDPRIPNVPSTVSNEATLIQATSTFIHVFERQPIRAVASYDYSLGRTVRTELPWTQRDHLFRAVSGRIFVLCGGSQVVTACEVRDGRGELPVAALQVSRVNGALQLAVAGEAGFAVWAKSGQMWRRNLVTGEETVVLDELATARSVGDGRGVLLTTQTRALAVDASRVREFPGRFVTALDVAALGGAADLPQAQTVLIIGSSASGGEQWLTAWNLESGRLARLTDSLNFNPPFAAPLTAGAHCEVPGFVRPSGEPSESAFVESKLLHFTEFVPQEHPVVRLFVMPVDLSAPPRLVAETIPDACGTPLGDETKLWFPQRTAGTELVKTTWAAP